MAASVALAACSSGAEQDAAPGTTRATASTAPAPAGCPGGSTVPDAAPSAVPPPIAATDVGPDPRAGALDIGTLLPRTGDLAFLGPATIAGVELAVADLAEAGGVLGAPVGLRHGDSAEGSPGVAEAEAARLLGAGADVLVGPLSSGTAALVLPQVAEADAVLVSPAATSGGLDALDGDGHLFRTGPTEALQGRALAELIRSDGHSTVSIAARDDDYGRAVAEALQAGLSDHGGTVASRVDHDPTANDLGPSVVGQLDLTADAIVVVALAEAALVLDALAAAGHAPSDRAVYGTDGNLGERLADLVEDPGSLACLRGLLPVATPDDAFAARVRAHDAALADLDAAGLDLAAEAYDAVVIAALAAASTGSDTGAALAGAMGPATLDGTPCTEVARCLELAGAGDVAYEGRSGPIALDEAGNRTAAGLTLVSFDADGHLARLGGRPARP